MTPIRLMELDIAIQEGDFEAVKQLITDDVNAITRRSAMYGTTALHMAAYYGHQEIIKELIAKGADVNARTNEGDTSLHKAVAEGNKEAVELLITAGADVNARNDFEITPLHEATGSNLEKGHLEITELLLANGADVNAKDDGGTTPLSEAVHGGHHKDLIDLLLANGADMNAVDHGSTLLDYAKSDNPEIADILRKHGGKTGEELK